MRTYRTEEEILDGIKGGDDAALAVLYKEHYRMVSHFILNNSGSDEDAKDVYQEAVVILYEKIVSGSFTLSCKIGTFLYSVGRRNWLRKLAGKGRVSGKIEDFQEFIPITEEVGEFQEESFETMGQCLVQLGQPCKAIIEEYYMHNASMQEICDKFGYTNADNAKNQKYKCLMRLKKLFFSLYQPKEA